MNENDYKNFADMPETPYIPPEDDPKAEHLMGCLYACVGSLVLFMLVIILYMCIKQI